MNQTHHPTVEFRRKMIAHMLEASRSRARENTKWGIWLNGLVAGFMFGVITGMALLAQFLR